MIDRQTRAAEMRRAFHRLHEAGCFMIPNPWDVGGVRLLQSLGFKALATTSSGHGWSQGLPDGAMPLGGVLAHLRQIVEASDVPVNADFGNGFSAHPEGVEANVALAIETGVAGLSIEDATGDELVPLFDIDTAVSRIRAARAAVDKAGGDTLLVGRAECFLVGRPDLDETIRRLRRYAEAGADCLYAPGISTREEIAAVVAAVAPKPVNLLVGSAGGLAVEEIAALGIRRVSVGGALARVAWAAFANAARLIAEQGRFDGFADALPGQSLDAFFRSDSSGREGRDASAS